MKKLLAVILAALMLMVSFGAMAEEPVTLTMGSWRTDDAEQVAVYREMERNLTENAANVYIQDMADLVAVRNGVEGLTFYPLYVLDVSTLYWAD